MKLVTKMNRILNEPLGIRVAVANPDISTLTMLNEIAHSGIVKPLLIGSTQEIKDMLAGFSKLASICKLIESRDPADMSVALVADGKADMLMKGDVHTDHFIKAVLTHKLAIPGRRLSHLYAFLFQERNPLFVTDPSIAISPDIKAKQSIIENAIDALHTLGISKPNIALLSSLEYATPKLPSSMDADTLTRLYLDRDDAFVYGPLGLDNAISLSAARTKQIVNPVAGRADCLVVPDLDSGNILCKGLVYIAGIEAAGLIVGATCPIVFTSRSASPGERRRTLQLACLYVKLNARKTKK